MIDIGQIEPVVASMHGDQRELIELLRSAEPLCQSVRNYLADELQKEPTKRFRQQSKVDRYVARNDYRISFLLRDASWEINVEQGFDLDKPVAEADALDWLAKRGTVIDPDSLPNVKKRRRSAKK